MPTPPLSVTSDQASAANTAADEAIQILKATAVSGATVVAESIDDLDTPPPVMDPPLAADAKTAGLRKLAEAIALGVLRNPVDAAASPVHNVGDSGEPAFQNSWVNSGGTDTVARFYKIGGSVVHLEGTVKTGSVGTVIFTLPSGYRPLKTVRFAVVSSGSFGSVTIVDTGEVTASSGSSVSFCLDGVTFRVDV